MKELISNIRFYITTICCSFLISVTAAYPAVFTVDNNGDVDNLAAYTAGDGTNTLRKCIRLANANAGLDNINFNISAAPYLITAGSSLPSITSPVYIDGLTQAGASAGNLLIEVDGFGTNVLQLAAGSAGSTLQGLIIYGANRGIHVLNSNGNIILANQIGTNAAGTAAAPALITQVGIIIENSLNTIIGGTGGINTRNIISGISENGIRIQGTSTGTLIRGNYIGTNKNGNGAIPNLQNGILIENGGSSTVIGGATTNHRNIISGNTQRGMLIQGSINCIIQNNFIGTDVTGNAALGNNTRGFEVTNSSHNLQILDNVVCSNTQHGMSVNTSDRPVIKGNRVGLALNGTTQLGNGEAAMEINNCFKPIVGGAALSERNYVSNNGQMGVRISNGDSAIVRGNYIGVDQAGMLDYGNGQSGISISASDNVIVENNLTSGNSQHGISIASDPTANAIVKGNIVGLGADLSASIPNLQLGLELSSCENSIIGGALLSERNYISANNANAIQISNSPYTVVKGNYIGVDGTGLLNRGNRSDGIRVSNSREVIIGGGSAAERNIVCASRESNGIALDASPKCIVKGNFCGIGVDGTTDLGNWASGISLGGTADSATIGGSLYMERNISSANGKSGIGDGIRVEGPDAHIILGNFCGVDSTGTIVKPNAWAGISLNESNDNIVGGSGAFEGNICSGNLNEGIWLRNALRNKFYGNFIGTDRSGSLQLGNEDWGIAISAAGPNLDNIVGGSLANANTIAYNLNIAGSGSGVDVASDSHRNLITFNKIFCNAGLGIRLNGTGNESVAAPVISTSGTNTVSGTGTNGYIIHVYRNATSDGGIKCDCEGEIYIGTTTVSGAGTWTLTHNLGLSASDAGTVTATQTNGTNSTSQFSNCNPPLPVTYLYFNAKKIDDKALLSWATSSEKNNKEFAIQRSTDGINFFTIGTVPGNNNSSQINTYSFVDDNPPLTTVYYRILQIDYDGKSSISPVRQLSFSDEGISVKSFSDKEIRIQSFLEKESELIVTIFSANGQLCYNGTYKASQGFFEKSLSFPGFATGIYLVKIYNSQEQYVKKIEIK